MMKESRREREGKNQMKKFKMKFFESPGNEIAWINGVKRVKNGERAVFFI